MKKMLGLLIILLVVVIVALSFPSTAEADGGPCGIGCKPVPPAAVEVAQ